MSTVIACPQCRQNLQVPPEMLGKEVRCPGCQHIFTADADGVRAGVPPLTVPPPLPPDDLPEWEKPRPGGEPDDDFAEPLEDADTDADGAEKPRKRKQSRKGSSGGGYYEELTRKQRKMQAPHRGVTVLLLGIFSVLCSPGFLLSIGACACGYYAYQFGSHDLGEMQTGRMDRSGEALTRVGWVMGIAGVCISVPFILASIAIMICGLIRAMTGPVHRL